MPGITFTTLDWIVLAGYFALLLGTGIYFNRKDRQKTSLDYFLAGHKMPVWAVTFSILATTQSAATFIGVPAASYRGSLTYLSLSLGTVIAACIVAWIFVPAYFRAGVVTPYELLERRFGPASRRATSLAFLVGRVMASGARTYIGALPVSLAMYGDTSTTHLVISVCLVMLVGTLYTLWGGVSSVIWTDVIQVTVYVGAGVVAILVLLHRIPLSIPEIFDLLRHTPIDAGKGLAAGSKLRVLDVGVPFDPRSEQTLWTVLTGFMLLNLAVFATDQDIVQKCLTCRTSRQGAISALTGTLVGIPVVMVFLAVGALLFVYYQCPQVMGPGAPAPPANASEVFQTFILSDMPAGLSGLMIAGVLAIGPAGINATLNGMASTLINDLYRPWVPGRTEGHYLAAGRLGVLFCGVLLTGFAVVCVYWKAARPDQPLIDFALNVMGYAYAGLLGVFLTALLTRRGNSFSVIAGLVAGFCTVIACTPEVMARWLPGPHALGEHAPPLIALAYPWQLVIGTLVATLVCAAPPKKHP